MRVFTLLFAALASFTGSAALGHAQQATSTPFLQDYYERQSFNEGFEQGLANWQVKNASSQGVTIENWESMPDDVLNPASLNRKFLTDPNDGRRGQVLKISGRNGIWQYAPVTNAARFQVACCNARKRLIPGQSGEMGWAGFGVIYFDAAWQEVARIEQQVFEFKLDLFNVPDRFSQGTVGTSIPTNAVHAILWLANDGPNTELWADDLVLLNEFIGVPLEDRTKPHGSRLRQNPAETSLIVNNYFNGIISFDDNDVNDEFDEPGRSIFSNAEFHWQGSGDVRRGLMYQEAAYWQVVELKPNLTYDLTIAYNNTSVAVAGIDFYDENWKPIGKVSKPLEGIVNVEFNGYFAAQDKRRFTAPAGTRYATVFVWQAPGEFSELLIVQATLRPVPCRRLAEGEKPIWLS